MKCSIGLQLYSVRKSFAENLDTTLAAVREIGYTDVEFAGVAPYSAEELGKALERHDLRCSGFHMPYDLLRTDEDSFRRAVEYVQATKASYAVIPAIPKTLFEHADRLKEETKYLSEVATRLREMGILTGYHNHNTEFTPLPGGTQTAWEILRDNTPDFFMMQLDTGNARSAGDDIDVVALLEGVKKSKNTIHFKPYDTVKKTEPAIGDDDTDYTRLLSLYTKREGLHPVIVEYECTTLYSEIEGVKRCFDGLMKYKDLM